MRFAFPLLALVPLAACSGRNCPAANEPRADDAAVSGVTVETLMAALTEPLDSVALEWSDGTTSVARASIVVVPGTAHRVQRADCLDECNTRYRYSMACSPEQLVVDAGGVVSTDDGRVVDLAWSGSISATAVDGPIVWTARSDALPPASIGGTADWDALGSVADDSIDVGVSVVLYGEQSELDVVEFAMMSQVDHDDDGKADAVVGTWPASAPTADP